MGAARLVARHRSRLRPGTNIKAGGRTPVAGMVHVLTLLLITLRQAGVVVAAILVVVAWNMSEWRVFRSELQAPRNDVAVLLTTFLLTVLVDLTVAIRVGMVLAAFLFMLRMAEVASVTALTGEPADGEEPALRGEPVPPGVEDGPFFFGAAEKFRETLGQVKGTSRVWIILMRRVSAIDSTGIRMLRALVRGVHKDGARVILVGGHAQPMVALGRADLLDEIDAAGLCGTLDEALDAARAHLGFSPAPRTDPPVATAARGPASPSR
ncbi:MAG TPA: STAS domain-containing protein [Longimicrobium sp.]|nr:STAS domain-containing protein [Longimicrobium sp.]